MDRVVDFLASSLSRTANPTQGISSEAAQVILRQLPIVVQQRVQSGEVLTARVQEVSGNTATIELEGKAYRVQLVEGNLPQKATLLSVRHLPKLATALGNIDSADTAVQLRWSTRAEGTARAGQTVQPPVQPLAPPPPNTGPRPLPVSLNGLLARVEMLQPLSTVTRTAALQPATPAAATPTTSTGAPVPALPTTSAPVATATAIPTVSHTVIQPTVATPTVTPTPISTGQPSGQLTPATATPAGAPPPAPQNVAPSLSNASIAPSTISSSAPNPTSSAPTLPPQTSAPAVSTSVPTAPVSSTPAPSTAALTTSNHPLLGSTSSAQRTTSSLTAPTMTAQTVAPASAQSVQPATQTASSVQVTPPANSLQTTVARTVQPTISAPTGQSPAQQSPAQQSPAQQSPAQQSPAQQTPASASIVPANSSSVPLTTATSSVLAAPPAPTLPTAQGSAPTQITVSTTLPTTLPTTPTLSVSLSPTVAPSMAANVASTSTTPNAPAANIQAGQMPSVTAIPTNLAHQRPFAGQSTATVQNTVQKTSPAPASGQANSPPVIPSNMQQPTMPMIRIAQNYQQTAQTVPSTAMTVKNLANMTQVGQQMRVQIYDPRLVPKGQTQISATASGVDQAGRTIVQTPRGQMALMLPQPLPLQTSLVLVEPTDLHPALSRNRFSAMEALLGAAGGGSALAKTARNTLPQPNAGMATSMLFFLHALRQMGGLQSLWGSSAQTEGQQRLFQAADEEFSRAKPQTLAADPAWQNYHLPLQMGDEIIKLLVYWRQGGGEKKNPQSSEKSLFAIEGYHHDVGRFRVDGQFLRPRFSLQWASDRAFSHQMENTLSRVFREYSELYSLEGQIQFMLLGQRALWMDDERTETQLQI